MLTPRAINPSLGPVGTNPFPSHHLADVSNRESLADDAGPPDLVPLGFERHWQAGRLFALAGRGSRVVIGERTIDVGRYSRHLRDELTIQRQALPPHHPAQMFAEAELARLGPMATGRQVVVVNDRSLNAGVHLDGTIVIGCRLFRPIDYEDALPGLLHHEITHDEKEHPALIGLW